MLTNAEAYDSHRTIQLRDTSVFLESIVQSQMDWSHEEHDVVMDVGCGPGGSLRDIIFLQFPRVKKFIGIDSQKDFITYAKENYADEKIEFHLADIEDRQTVEKWFGKVSKIISIYCFNWLKDIERGFENIYHLLKPGGEAGLLVCVASYVWTSAELLRKNPKWSKYLQNGDTHVPDSYFKKRDERYYRNLLETMGFEIVVCEIKERTYTHEDDDDCRDCWYPVSGMANNIPDDLKQEFKQDMFKALMKYNTRTPDGKPVSHYTNLTLLIRKKDPPTSKA